MRKTLLVLFCLALPSATFAEEPGWSVGAGVGPFVFGKFFTRHNRFVTETGTAESRSSLSASTRPGVSVDIGRDINSWLAVRAVGTFTDAPLSVKTTGSSSGIALDAGKLKSTTIALPFLIKLNRNGAFRFHVGAGPAYADYNIERRAAAGTTIFSGSRTRWGAMAEGGVTWWWSKRFAAEATVSDVVTSSPFERSDFPASSSARIDIPKPHNVHTAFGLRIRF